MNTSRYMIGYARTSTIDQNLDAQMIALKAAGCSVVRTEQKSGTSLDGLDELKTIIDFIHAGETLVVTRIDRLARSLSDLQAIVARLKEKGAHLAATEQPVDTSTATGKAFFDMLKPGGYLEVLRSKGYLVQSPDDAEETDGDES